MESIKEALEKIEQERTAATTSAFKIQALVKLFLDSAGLHSGKVPEGLDVYTLIEIFGDLIEDVIARLDKVNSLTYGAERKLKEQAQAKPENQTQEVGQ